MWTWRAAVATSPLLQLANKFIGGLTPEVVVDLSTAQTELAKTGGTPQCHPVHL